MTDESRIDEILAAWQLAREEGRFIDPDVLIAANPTVAGGSANASTPCGSSTS